ncbi:sulfatase [Larkinella soli]|uniref:sulfatase n=1 Tax=Larkinella soli TaxID=1770527 RepID=UPI000FFC9C38|nr:sulfatase [Larkinella soli]
MKVSPFLILPILIFLISAGRAAGQNPPAKSRPNIVFILADDLGYSDLGCYGNPYNRTPNIDGLAKKGLKFRDAYSACPVCSPSRAAILTGKHPVRMQLTNFLVGERRDSTSPVFPANWRKYMPPSETTLAEMLKSRGYQTSMIGKWHLGGADTTAPAAQGFTYDRVIGRNGLDYYNYSITSRGKTVFEDKGTTYLTDRLTDYALEFIDQNKAQPFFLYLAYSAPHIMLVPRADKLRYYFDNYEKFGGRYNPNYGAMIESMDDGVGRIMAELSRHQLLDNTIVVFTSDNGGVGLPELGPVPTRLDPLRAWKGHVYEGGIRVPLIFSWNGRIPDGTETTNRITGTDFVPTFLEMLGIRDQPVSPDGRSFYGVLTNPAKPVDRGPMYWHYPHFSNQMGRPAGAVRVGDYKLVELYETGKLELYNLKEDVAEKNNLAAVQPDKTRELADLLRKWRKEVNANMPAPNPKYVQK